MHGTLMFLDIGGGEIFIILLIVVMFFGSDKIPEIARGLAKGIRQVKDAASDIQSEISKTAGLDGDLQKFKDKVDKERKEIEEITGSIKRDMNK